MRADEMSGRLFLDSMPKKSGLMGMAESDRGPSYDDQKRDLEAARSGKYVPPEHRGRGSLELETLSEINQVQADVYLLHQRLARMEQMIEFLVLRVPDGSKPKEAERTTDQQSGGGKTA